MVLASFLIALKNIYTKARIISREKVYFLKKVYFKYSFTIKKYTFSIKSRVLKSILLFQKSILLISKSVLFLRGKVYFCKRKSILFVVSIDFITSDIIQRAFLTMFIS